MNGIAGIFRRKMLGLPAWVVVALGGGVLGLFLLSRRGGDGDSSVATLSDADRNRLDNALIAIGNLIAEGQGSQPSADTTIPPATTIPRWRFVLGIDPENPSPGNPRGQLGVWAISDGHAYPFSTAGLLALGFTREQIIATPGIQTVPISIIRGLIAEPAITPTNPWPYPAESAGQGLPMVLAGGVAASALWDAIKMAWQRRGSARQAPAIGNGSGNYRVPQEIDAGISVLTLDFPSKLSPDYGF